MSDGARFLGPIGTESEFSADEYESLVTSLEAADPRAPIANVEPVTPGTKITRELISRYFNGHLYPYEERLPLRRYYETKVRLQIELVKLQNWVQENGKRLVLIFEGRDTAGKGSSIRAFMEYLNPRKARVVALEKPTEEERGQWYFQRYIKELPSRGEMSFFDRSWYNRAGVEHVMGFCTQPEYDDFIEHVPIFEKMLVTSGIHLVKFYLSVSQDEQVRRVEERRTNPLKHWKLSPNDIEAQRRWDDYTDAKNKLFELTDSEHGPWTIVKTEDKQRGRLEAIKHVLNQFDYDDKDEEVIGEADPLIVTPARNLLDSEGRAHMID